MRALADASGTEWVTFGSLDLEYNAGSDGVDEQRRA